jgi:hypothetical protein
MSFMQSDANTTWAAADDLSANAPVMCHQNKSGQHVEVERGKLPTKNGCSYSAPECIDASCDVVISAN